MDGMPPRDPYLSNTTRGTVHGRLLQARDIHDVTLTSAPRTGSPESAAPDVSLDPPRLATAVRGRTRLIEELTAVMNAGAPVPHVLTGPGGFGKTTVAAALAERARADGRRVFWVRAGDVSTGLLEAAVEVGGARSEAEQLRESPQRAARWVWQHLDRSPEPWLLVLDNADRPEELDPHHRPGEQVGWLRSSPAGFVLVTSRLEDPALWAPARVHTVAELDSAAAGAALADHAGEEALPGAEELAERLGGVPLALALAGRILAIHRVLFPDARALSKRLDEEGLEHLDTLAEPFAREDRGLLSGVWAVSLDLVARREPKAPVLLRLLAVLGSEGAPVPLRRLDPQFLRDEPLPLSDRAELARTVNALVVHGLVTVRHDGDETDLRLHPLVSETVRTGMGESDFDLLNLAERLVLHKPGRDPHLVARAMAHSVRIHAKALLSREAGGPDEVLEDTDGPEALLAQMDAYIPWLGCRHSLRTFTEHTRTWVEHTADRTEPAPEGERPHPDSDDPG